MKPTTKKLVKNYNLIESYKELLRVVNRMNLKCDILIKIRYL